MNQSLRSSKIDIPEGDWDYVLIAHSVSSQEPFYPAGKEVDSRYISFRNAKRKSVGGYFEPSKEDVDRAKIFVAKHFPRIAALWCSEIDKLSFKYPSSWWIYVLKTIKHQEMSGGEIKPFGYIVAIMDRWLVEGISKGGIWNRYDDDMKTVGNVWKKPEHRGDVAVDENVDVVIDDVTSEWKSRAWSR